MENVIAWVPPASSHGDGPPDADEDTQQLLAEMDAAQAARDRLRNLVAARRQAQRSATLDPVDVDSLD
jgi:hypothetical protein